MCMCVYISMSVPVPAGARDFRVTLTPGLRVTGDCEPPMWVWKSDSGPLQEQYLLLTTEPSKNVFFCELKKC